MTSGDAVNFDMVRCHQWNRQSPIKKGRLLQRMPFPGRRCALQFWEVPNQRSQCHLWLLAWPSNIPSKVTKSSLLSRLTCDKIGMDAKSTNATNSNAQGKPNVKSPMGIPSFWPILDAMGENCYDNKHIKTSGFRSAEETHSRQVKARWVNELLRSYEATLTVPVVEAKVLEGEVMAVTTTMSLGQSVGDTGDNVSRIYRSKV